jgi:hypothetical protein
MMDVNASYTWNSLGQMTSTTYPVAAAPGGAPSGPTFNYTFDAEPAERNDGDVLERPAGTDLDAKHNARDCGFERIV